MDFFRYLVYCNGRCLRTHQIQILKIMQDDSYHSIMIPTNYDLPSLISEYEKDNEDSHEVIMSPQLTYFCSFFQIMSSLIDNNNAVNIGKLVKRYPFDLLVTYIEQAKTCGSTTSRKGSTSISSQSSLENCPISSMIYTSTSSPNIKPASRKVKIKNSEIL